MPPQGGDPAALISVLQAVKFQSTPPHGRRPGRAHQRAAGGEVSIHASAREATPDHCAAWAWSIRFNPRLRTGGDMSSPGGKPVVCCFNPRLRTGGDGPGRSLTVLTQRFQSTPPHGRRRVGPGSWARLVRFQSTPPHGRRPSRRCSLPLTASGFNPRLRTGGDFGRSDGLNPCTAVSIHASAREATPTRSPVAVICLGFNPRLRTGGDNFAPSIAPKHWKFQSTPPHGRRR